MVRKVRKRTRTNRTALWIVVLLLVVVLAGWWIWTRIYNTPPEFYYIQINKDGSPLKLLKGETFRLHPGSRIYIQDISTNIYFNYGIRLVSKDLDANALLYEEIPLSTLLPDEDIFAQYSFRLNLKHFNEDLGYVDLEVEPYVEDWLDKADRTIGAERKAEILENALKFHPEDKKIRDRLIKLYISTERWEQAALLLETAAKERPGQEVYSDLLKVYEAISMNDKVISVLRKLIEFELDNLDLRFRLAIILEETGSLLKSVAEYEKILGIAAKEELLPVYQALGFLYTETGQLDKAISAYLNAAALDEYDVNLYHNLSLLYEKTGQGNKADQYLAKAVEMESGDTESRFKLIESLINKGNFKEAEKHLNEILKNKPNSRKALLYMVSIAEKQGDKEGLKSHYLNILSLEPENEVVIYNLGVLEYETGNLAKAVPFMEKYIKNHPEDVAVRAILFDIYDKLKEDDLAYNEAMSIINLKPMDISYYHYVFKYLFEREEYNKLIKAIEGGLKVLPKEIDLRKYLVLAYLKIEKEDLAIGQIEEILKITPEDITLLFQLGSLQEKQGDFEGAANAFKKILEQSPDHKEAKEAYLKTLLLWARHKESQDDLKGALNIYKEIIDTDPGHEDAGEAYLRLRFQVLPDESDR